MARGIFVTILAIEEFDIELDNGVRVKYEELHKCLRLSHVRELSGPTLHSRVQLETTGAHFRIKHLYVGASRATSSELLEVQ